MGAEVSRRPVSDNAAILVHLVSTLCAKGRYDEAQSVVQRQYDEITKAAVDTAISKCGAMFMVTAAVPWELLREVKRRDVFAAMLSNRLGNGNSLTVDELRSVSVRRLANALQAAREEGGDIPSIGTEIVAGRMHETIQKWFADTAGTA